MNLPLSEIFSSVQGEGIFIGCRQLFLRFSGCNLSCDYCDTLLVPEHSCKAEIIPGSNKFKYLSWPIDVDHILDFIYTNYNLSKHHSVSITGGEPLLHYSALRKVLPEIRGTKNGIFLETNGILHKELNEIIDYVNFISMDIKLPSISKTRFYLKEHDDFLKAALGSKTYIYVKIVVSSYINLEELKTACKLIRKKTSDITLVIQPINSQDKTILPTTSQLLYYQETALDFLNDVRIIPQTNKYLGLL